MKISILRELIEQSNNIVFFGGAGVSTESGIPDFRSQDGLYNQKYAYPPEQILSHSFFINNTLDFYKFYRDKMMFDNIQPNYTHDYLALLERTGKLKAIITQNIDGLHQKAGSSNVIELHGSIERNYCQSCHKFFNSNIIKYSDGLPYCECGGIIKPDVVLYDERLDDNVLSQAIMYISNADLLIVGGTSLNVYPAAGLIDFYKGDKLVLINKEKTPLDYKANYIINDKLSEVFKNINR